MSWTESAAYFLICCWCKESFDLRQCNHKLGFRQAWVQTRQTPNLHLTWRCVIKVPHHCILDASICSAPSIGVLHVSLSTESIERQGMNICSTLVRALPAPHRPLCRDDFSNFYTGTLLLIYRVYGA